MASVMGFREVAVAVAAVLIGACGGASASHAAVAEPTVTAARPSVSATPTASSSAEGRIDGDAIWVNDARVEGDDLSGPLRQARGAAELLSVRLSAGYTEVSLARLLAAAPEAGFKQVRLAQASETLTVSTRDAHSKVRLMAWAHDGRLVGYDLQESAVDRGMLGPFQLTDEAAVAALRDQVVAACKGQPCSAELDLLPGQAPGGMWQALRSWQRAVSALPAFSSQVLAVDTHPPPPRGGDPKVQYGATTVSGRLPPAVIQLVVRKHFGNLRGCYEPALGINAALTGRVSVRFVIGRDGKVSHVTDGGSDIPDPQVVSCVLQVFTTFEFPPPANGIVTVVYPVMFAPG